MLRLEIRVQVRTTGCELEHPVLLGRLLVGATCPERVALDGAVRGAWCSSSRLWYRTARVRSPDLGPGSQK